MSDRDGFAMPEGLDGRDFVIATYVSGAPGADIHEPHASWRSMQSTGTWVTLERETEAIRERHAARVLATWEMPDHEAGDPTPASRLGHPDRLPDPQHRGPDPAPARDGLRRVRLGRATSSSSTSSCRQPFVGAFKGPQFGLDGIRTLVGAPDRPLLITMMKPAIGLTPKESAEVFHQAAIGGSDGVKDDELLVSHPWSHFLDRVREHERAAQAAFEETGHRTLYFVNITDRPDRLVQTPTAPSRPAPPP